MELVTDLCFSMSCSIRRASPTDLSTPALSSFSEAFPADSSVEHI